MRMFLPVCPKAIYEFVNDDDFKALREIDQDFL